MAVSIDFDAPWDVQITQARAQNVKLSDIYYRLAAEKRAYAQTVSGLAQLDQVQRVADALAQAQASGDTLADFKKWAKTQDWTLPKGRLETIYRNSVQTAYQAGHWRDFEENAKERPYLFYDAINDSRVRPSHLALDGVIKPVADPFWLTSSPPLGHRCRCTLRSLSQREAMAKGGVTQNVPVEGKADEGWGHKPTEWDKTLEKVKADKVAAAHPDLGQALDQATAGAPAKKLRKTLETATVDQRLDKVIEWVLAHAKDAKLPVSEHGMAAPENMRHVTFDGIQWMAPTDELLAEQIELISRSPMLSRKLRGSVTRVIITTQSSQHDAYWKSVNPNFGSSRATGGNAQVVVYKSGVIDIDTLAHEAGHLLAEQKYGSAYKTPPEFDAASVLDGFVTDYARDMFNASKYCENFAEAVAAWQVDPDGLKRRHPNIYKVIEGIFNPKPKP